MEKLNEFTITDILYELVFEHLDRFRELRKQINDPKYAYFQKQLKDRLSAEITLYNEDIREIYEIADMFLNREEFNRIADSIREQFNIYMLDIFKS